MSELHRYCVILCGGIGSRFWPRSRQMRPKQFLDFFGTGRSLLQMCYDRVAPVVGSDHIFVVTNERYAPLVSEQLPELGSDRILCEPVRRNTAPAIAWASYHIRELDSEAVIAVMPSDHLITREDLFRESLEQGFDFVGRRNVLLTIGVEPSRPETGFGYIQKGEESESGIMKVKTFTEKPNREMAEIFLGTGEFLWNSGIFMWRARCIIEALHRYAPEVAEVFDRGAGLYGTDAESLFIRREFASCPLISVDYAVMEKADNVYVECAEFGWNDLESWGSLYDVSPKNREGNVTQRCRVLSYSSCGNIVTAEGSDKLIAIAGLDGYIVADSDDVLLICPRSREDEIRGMVDDSRMAFGERFV